MANKWVQCLERQPDDTSQVMVALPDRPEVVSAEYVAETGQWFHANTNDECWPTMWRNMPEHPFGGE